MRVGDYITSHSKTSDYGVKYNLIYRVTSINGKYRNVKLVGSDANDIQVHESSVTLVTREMLRVAIVKKQAALRAEINLMEEELPRIGESFNDADNSISKTNVTTIHEMVKYEEDITEADVLRVLSSTRDSVGVIERLAIIGNGKFDFGFQL